MFSDLKFFKFILTHTLFETEETNIRTESIFSHFLSNSKVFNLYKDYELYFKISSVNVLKYFMELAQ